MISPALCGHFLFVYRRRYNTYMETNFKKIITLLSVLILFLIIVFTIIPNRNKEKIDVKNTDLKATTTISESEEVVFNEENDFYIISAKYPKEIEKDVKKIIDDTKKEWSLDGELYQNEKKLRADFPDRPIMKYELNIQYDKYSSINLDTHSYIIKTYVFTGGAHGNTTVSTYTFNKNGIVKIDNILNLENDNALKLTKIIFEKLKKNLGKDFDLNMLQDGLGLAGGTGFDYKTNLANFIVNDQGITFIYEQYQVAAYSFGVQEVSFSWEELEGYLR